MSDKVKKFDAGGSILDQSNIAGQIFAQQPSGIGSAGTPLNLSAIQQSYGSTFPMDLDYMDMLEEAADRADPDLVAEFEKEQAAQNLQKAQEDAAYTYASLVLGKQPTTAAEFAAIKKAKQALVDLGVSREQIEAVKIPTAFGEKSVDASKGIEGVFGPSIGGAVKQGYENLIDLYGTGALQALGSVIELAGGDKDLVLADTKVGFNPIGPGVSYIFGDDGKVRTTSLGQTKTGTPVVLTGPIGAAGAIGGDILRGDIDIFGIPGAVVGAVGGPAGVVQTAANAGVLGLGDDSGEEGGDVFLDQEAILTSILNDDDPDKENKTTDQVTVDPNAGDPIGPVLVATSDQLPSVDRVSLPEAQVPVDRVSLPEAQVPVDRVSLPEAQVAVDRVSLPEAQVAVDRVSLPEAQVAVTRTSLPEAVVADILASERTDPTRTALPEPTRTSVETAAAGGGGGGGGGTTAPSGGIRTVSGGPGPSVDIDYLYDFARGLEQPFQATEEEEEDIVRAAEGGMIGGTDDFERILRILRGM